MLIEFAEVLEDQPVVLEPLGSDVPPVVSGNGPIYPKQLPVSRGGCAPSDEIPHLANFVLIRPVGPDGTITVKEDASTDVPNRMQVAKHAVPPDVRPGMV